MPTPELTSRAPARNRLRGAPLWRPLALLLGAGVVLAWLRGDLTRIDGGDLDPSLATANALRRLGFTANPHDIHWVDPPTSWRLLSLGSHRFVVLAQLPNELPDVWLGTARHSPEGRQLGVTDLHNISDTSAVAESQLTVSGENVAWTVVTNDNDTLAVQVADLKGRRLPKNGDLTTLERLQTRLTFLQETGQFAGLCHQAYRFKAPQPEVSLAWTDDGLEVQHGNGRAVLRCDAASATDPELAIEPSEVGAPGDLITWAVDRVRAIPWIGTDRVQWLKAVSFGWLEHFTALSHRVARRDVAAEVKAEMGEKLVARAATIGAEPAPPGWPPAPMTPILTPAIRDEGAFRPLDEDPFAVRATGARSPFALAFLRADPTQPDSQLFVLVWDPRRLELHTMPGTREPKTATGETGSGTVPRNAERIGRLAAAFNGGFQATHGEFGMMAERVVYLPPRPYAATIAELADGSLAMGTWPEEAFIPDTMVGFRQNLTPLVADGVENPYKRTWWGGVPAGWQDATRTVRTGLCLTRDDFVAYFYGSSLSAQHLTRAMTTARCSYGIHLDMNPGHTGLELYRVGRIGTLPKLNRKLDTNWEATGVVPGAPEWEFLGRRLLRSMHLMHFPRYVRTDSRDFIYLTHRHLLPPDANAPDSPASQAPAEQWQIPSHAQHGYPPVVATRRLHPEPTRPELEVAVTVLDAQWLIPCTTNCGTSPEVLRFNRSSSATDVGVFYFRRGFVVAPSSPDPSASAIAWGRDEAHASRASAAIGVAHGTWLYYAVVTRGSERARDATLLKRILSSLQCETSLYLERPLSLTLGDGSHAREPRDSELVLVRNDAPMVQRLFTDTPVVAPSAWQPLQAKRVGYARQHPTSTHAEPTPGHDFESDQDLRRTPDSSAD